jgi:hypothetical protein
MAGSTASYSYTRTGDNYIFKLDSNGKLLWSKAGENGNSQEQDGINYIINTQDSGIMILINYDCYYCAPSQFVDKMDKNGNGQWSSYIGGDSTVASVAYCAIETKDSHYIITGEEAFPKSSKIYVYKLNISGNLIWLRNIGGAIYDGGNSVVETYDLGYAIVGSTNSFGAGSNDVYAVKLDSGGNIKWTKTVGGINNDIGTSIVQTSDNGLAIAGYTNSFGAGSYDFYIIKLDSAGNLKWTKTIGGTGDDEAEKIIQCNDKGLIIVGYTLSYGVNPGVASSLYVVKLDSTGNLLWTKTIGGTKGAEGYSISQTYDGGYAIAGTTYAFSYGNAYFVKLDSMGNFCEPLISDSGRIDSGGTVSSGGGTINCGCYVALASPIHLHDSGSIVTDICGIPATVNNVQEKKNGMTLKPNPNNGQFMLQINSTDTNKVQLNYIYIYNTMGQLIAQITSKDNTIGINISNYPAGLYLIRVQSGGNSWCKKVVKE